MQRISTEVPVLYSNLPAGVPSAEGVHFRFIRGEQDAESVYALRAACVERDHVDLLSTAEGLPSCDEMRAVFARAVAAHEENRRLLALANDRVVGYSLIESWVEGDGRCVYLILGWVLPEWRGRGIGTAMLHWGEQTSRQLASIEHPNEPFEFAANANSTQPEATALVLNEGYYVGYTVLDMQLDYSARQLPQPLPHGFQVRPVLPEHIRRIAESIGEAYDNEYPDRRFQEVWNVEEGMERLSARKNDLSLWQVAWDGDQVAGQVLPSIEKGRAEIHEVSIRPAWRRKGLARALLTRALQVVLDRGAPMVRLHTNYEFPTRAMDLYASVGFRLMKEFPRYRKAPG